MYGGHNSVSGRCNVVSRQARQQDYRTLGDVQTAKEGVRTPIPKSSNFLFKDLFWEFGSMGKLWKHREVFYKFSIEVLQMF
jgi:hypothetical protein